MVVYMILQPTPNQDSCMSFGTGIDEFIPGPCFPLLIRRLIGASTHNPKDQKLLLYHNVQALREIWIAGMLCEGSHNLVGILPSNRIIPPCVGKCLDCYTRLFSHLLH